MKKNKKSIVTLMILIFFMLFSVNAMAQNIINKIGGTGENDEFQVTDSDGNEKLVIQGDGKVGIGTTTPNYELDVVGDINCSGNIYQSGSPSGQHYVGEFYGGGIVFYVYTDPNDGQQHGLIASLEDLNVGLGVQWYNGSNITTNASSFWNGANNTALIVSAQGTGTYAAGLCNDYTGGGQTDWYLPSIYELDILDISIYILEKNLESDGNSMTTPISKSTYYWSSTEYSNTISYGCLMINGNISNYAKNSLFLVRAIRSF